MFESRMLRSALGAMALGGAVLAWSVPASAGAGTGTWRNGMVAGPRGVGYYGGYRPAFGGYYGGYRPAYGGYYGGYYPHYGYRRRGNVGGALAAGLIGGLALGTLASAPYAYSYPAYSYPAAYGGYYGAGYYGAPVCYTTTQRGVDAWGRVVFYRTQVCE